MTCVLTTLSLCHFVYIVYTMAMAMAMALIAALPMGQCGQRILLKVESGVARMRSQNGKVPSSKFFVAERWNIAIFVFR
ncbi:MAG: hypothetical protein ACFCU3_10800 [Verrucomicrobiales bacterium]